ncbi:MULTISPECIES: lytic transglycosylase domain-containing protein [Bacillaceae]|uniref:lytic transglycosylase domain-containing protein n=1 Tax=Bacillaceae TaxID=186817 RepID=UPI000E76CD6E|nr:lytic transglycosylase domain-containing protein [Bacillus sp. PK3_68]RJS62312.1 hypothetical protein CJ483_21475 [Bacillus sp. PK3_68]
MKKRKLKKSVKRKLFFLLFIIAMVYVAFHQGNAPKDTVIEPSIPKEYVPIYKAAEKEYGVPWQLLAAHHRVETKFSTMESMISPAGAEGPMQFMPCTFVGWSHPTCSDLGKGNISSKDKVNPAIIKKYGGYGVDANGDGKADPFDLEDAVFSAAAYLKAHGAADGQLKKAIYSYNHSEQYVDDVLHYFYAYTSKE